MTIDWPFLVLGVLLLWFPRQWMRLGKLIRLRRRRSRTEDDWSQREPGDPRLSFRREFTKPRNYFDLLRATTGAIAITGLGEATPSIAATVGASSHEIW